MSMIDLLGWLCVADALATLSLILYATPRLAVGTLGQAAGSVFLLGTLALHVNAATLYLSGQVHVAHPWFIAWRTVAAVGAFGFSAAVFRSLHRER